MKNKGLGHLNNQDIYHKASKHLGLGGPRYVHLSTYLEHLATSESGMLPPGVMNNPVVNNSSGPTFWGGPIFKIRL